MRLIDADALLDNYGIKDAYRGGPLTGDIKLSFFTIHDMIKDAPTIDGINAVRCKECKHFNQNKYGNFCYHDLGMTEPTEDGFCSYGEKKAGE